MKNIFIITVISLFAYSALFAQEKVDTNLEVGTLPGYSGVSPSGAATYTIPLEFPEGRGGMTPRLSFVYNSQQGNNIMGKGWSLSGFSSIARTMPTLYHDGEMDKIDFEDDAFILDGMRLIKISEESNGQIHYRTEIDRMADIIYYPSGDHGDYFIVRTKDGITKEYGRTATSRQWYQTNANEENPSPMIWHLNSVYNSGRYNENINSQKIFYVINY